MQKHTFTFQWSGNLDDIDPDLIDGIYQVFTRRFDSGLKDLGDCDPVIGSIDNVTYVIFIDVPGAYEEATARCRRHLSEVGWPDHMSLQEGDIF